MPSLITPFWYWMFPPFGSVIWETRPVVYPVLQGDFIAEGILKTVGIHDGYGRLAVPEIRLFLNKQSWF